MTDADIKIENLSKKADEAAKKVEKWDKTLSSSYEHLGKYVKTQKEQNQLTKLFVKAKTEEIKKLKGELGENSPLFKLRAREIGGQIKDIKRVGSRYSALDKVLGKNKDAVVDFTDGIKAGLKNWKAVGVQGLITGLFELGKGAVTTALEFADAEKSIKDFQDVSKNFTGVPLLGPAFHAMAKSADFNVKIFKQLAQSGASFEGSIINLRNAAHNANMPIMDFTAMVAKNSEVMAQLFGSVDSGVKQMGSFQKRLRSVTQENFAQFGLNLEETSEFLSTYLILQRARGNLEQMSTDQVIQGTSAYTVNLIKLSKLTGESVDNLDKQNRQLATNGVFQAQLLKLQPAQRDAVNGVVAAFGGAETQLGKLVTQVVATGVATEEETALLNQAMGGGIVPLINQLAAGTIDVIGFNNSMRQMANSGATSAFVRDLSLASVVTGQWTGLINETFRLQGKGNQDLTNEMKVRKTMTAGLVGLRDTIDVVKRGAEKVTTIGMDNLAETSGYIMKAIGLMEKEGVKADPGKTTAAVLASSFDSSRGALRMIEGGAPGTGFWSRLLHSGPGAGATSAKGGSLAGEYSTPEIGMFATGTKAVTGERFPNFGTQGTTVQVHGPEAIIPRESPMGRIVAAVDNLTLKPTVNASVTTPASKNSGGNSDITAISSLLSRNLENISQIMDKSEKHLNTLVGINATVAKNTMDTRKGLANLSTSLV
jgi:hypothetical protein